MLKKYRNHNSCGSVDTQYDMLLYSFYTEELRDEFFSVCEENTIVIEGEEWLSDIDITILRDMVDRGCCVEDIISLNNHNILCVCKDSGEVYLDKSVLGSYLLVYMDSEDEESWELYCELRDMWCRVYNSLKNI